MRKSNQHIQINQHDLIYFKENLPIIGLNLGNNGFKHLYGIYFKSQSNINNFQKYLHIDDSEDYRDYRLLVGRIQYI